MEFMDVLGPAITTVLLNVLIAVLTAVGGYIVMLVKSKLNASQLELLQQIAGDVVLSVEQSNYGKEMINEAADKKSQAIVLMNSFLKKYSITLSEQQIDAAIEAAVANVINANKLVEPPKFTELDVSGTNTGFMD